MVWEMAFTLSNGLSVEAVQKLLQAAFAPVHTDIVMLDGVYLEVKEALRNNGYHRDFQSFAKTLYLEAKKRHKVSNKPTKQGEESLRSSTSVDTSISIKAWFDTPPVLTTGEDFTQSPLYIEPVEHMVLQVQKGLQLVDRDTILTAMAVVASHEYRDATTEKLWGIIEGPPASGKTELITLFDEVPKIRPLGQLTTKTFWSGLTAADAVGGVTPGILKSDEYGDFVFTFNDLGSVFSKDTRAKDEIFGQLLTIFDGKHALDFGNGSLPTWHGHISFLAGATDELKRQYSMLNKLGPRFLVWRLPPMDKEKRREAVRAAITNRGLDSWKSDTQHMMAQLYNFLPPTPVDTSAWTNKLQTLGELVALTRHRVERDGGDNIVADEAPEVDTRITMQLTTFVKALGRLFRRTSITDEEMRIATKFAFYTMPEARMKVILRLLVASNLSAANVARGTGETYRMINHALVDLSSPKAQVVMKSEQGPQEVWSLTEEWTQLLEPYRPYLQQMLINPPTEEVHHPDIEKLSDLKDLKDFNFGLN